MVKIRDVPVKAGQIDAGENFTFHPIPYPSNGLARMITENPAMSTLGQYYTYIQVRNTLKKLMVQDHFQLLHFNYLQLRVRESLRLGSFIDICNPEA